MPIGNVQFNPESLPIDWGQTNKPAAPKFDEYFSKMLKDVNQKMAHAEQVSKDFAAGETNNIHETMLAVEQAVLAFKMVGTVRNKAIEVYQEVMRMPV